MNMLTRHIFWLRFAIPVTLGVMLALTSGCNTTGKLIATSSTTVDHAMQGWAVYVVDGKATAEQEKQVRKAKDLYDAAEDAAVEAYTTFSLTGDKSRWEQARDYLWAQQRALISLVEQFTGRKVTQ